MKSGVRESERKGRCRGGDGVTLWANIDFRELVLTPQTIAGTNQIFILLKISMFSRKIAQNWR